MIIDPRAVQITFPEVRLCLEHNLPELLNKVTTDIDAVLDSFQAWSLKGDSAVHYQGVLQVSIVGCTAMDKIFLHNALLDHYEDNRLLKTVKVTEKADYSKPRDTDDFYDIQDMQLRLDSGTVFSDNFDVFIVFMKMNHQFFKKEEINKA